ncbi:hypothetical protein BV102_00722 [Haemophilus influenzae]|uniref:Uncharacterized protein n=2 Tax=Haemophilus influenzae TaxID=727 RepID=A0A2S9RQ30_HAEIF|nr:hypothetical protein BV102_00722 [Haemophilus influenzae]
MKDFKARSDLLNSINWITVKDAAGGKFLGALKGTTTGRKQEGEIALLWNMAKLTKLAR